MHSKRTHELQEKERLKELQRCELDALEEQHQAELKRATIERANEIMYVAIGCLLRLLQISGKRQNAKLQFRHDAI